MKVFPFILIGFLNFSKLNVGGDCYENIKSFKLPMADSHVDKRDSITPLLAVSAAKHKIESTVKR